MIDIGKEVANELRKRNNKKAAEHVKSGKLSAGKLNSPLLEQVLYILGVPTKPFDDYTLGLFKRGVDTEDAIIDLLPEGKGQEKVEYRNCVGLVDYIDQDGEVYEIKSTKNSAFKWIKKDGAKRGHKLQAALYALALDQPQYHIVYVASDDYRIEQLTFQTEDAKPIVDAIIDQVEGVFKSGTLPTWEPREPWQENLQYSLFPDWCQLTQDELMTKLESYDSAYNKLKGDK